MNFVLEHKIINFSRQWKKPTKTLHPTIYHLKSLIRAERAQREVALFCDLHGHSRKQNIFMYGCDDRRKPRPAVRVFPKLLSWNEIGRKYVSFSDCSFHVKKSREGTGRSSYKLRAAVVRNVYACFRRSCSCCT